MSDEAAHAAGVAAYRQLEAEAWDEAGEEADACICEDCVVRVVLEAAFPILRADVLAELGHAARD